MAVAVLIARNRDADLFTLLLKLNVLLGYPLVIPMVLGILYRRTPGWAAWSTVIVSMGTAYIVQNYIPPETIAGICGLAKPLNELEAKHIGFISSGVITLFAGSCWYFFTSLFYKQTTSEKYRQDVEAFFKDMNTPIDHAREHDGNQDSPQYKFMGILCLIYGGIMMLGFVIPNTLSDRMIFIYNGGAITLTGGILYYIYRRKKKSIRVNKAEAVPAGLTQEADCS